MFCIKLLNSNANLQKSSNYKRSTGGIVVRSKLNDDKLSKFEIANDMLDRKYESMKPPPLVTSTTRERVLLLIACIIIIAIDCIAASHFH